MALSQAQLLEIRARLAGVQAIARGTYEIKRELQGVRAENSRATQQQQRFNLAVAGGNAAIRANSNVVSRAVTEQRRLAQAEASVTMEQKRQQMAFASGIAQQRRLASESRIVATEMRKIGSADQTQQFGRAAKGMAGMLALYGSARFIAMGGMSAIRKYEQMQGLHAALVGNVGPAQAVGLEPKLNEAANRYGLDLVHTRAGAAQLLGTRQVKPEDVVGLITAFTALAGKGGASSEQNDRAFEQLVQIASQGQLQGDELRSIQENLVPLRTLLIDAGLGSRIGSQSNPLKWAEIQKALLDFGKKPEAQSYLDVMANRATTALERMENTITEKVVVPIGAAASPALIGFANGLTHALDGVDPDAIEAFGSGLVALVPALALGAATMKGLQAYGMVRLWASTIRLANAFDRIQPGSYGGGYGGGSSAGGSSGGSPPTGKAPKGGSTPGLGWYFLPEEEQAAQTAATARRAGMQGAKGFMSRPWLQGGLSKIGGFARGAAIGAGGVAGAALTGAAVDRLFGDNPYAHLILDPLGAGAGAKLTMAALRGAAGLGGGAAIGTAGSVGLVGAAAGGGIVALLRGIEMATGVKDDDSQILRMMNGGKASVSSMGPDQFSTIYNHVLMKRKAWQQSFHMNRLPAVWEFLRDSRDSEAATLLQMMAEKSAAASQASSSRQAAYDNHLAEAQARADRASR